MRRYRRLPVLLTVAAFALFLTCSGGAVAEPTADAGVLTTSNTTDSRSTNSLSLTKELSLTPSRPGEIAVRLRYDTPSNLAGLRVELPDDPAVTANRGFTRRDGEYVWDERTSTPTLSYRTAVNETQDASGPYAGSGDFLFVDAGPWALVRIPQVSTGWSWRGTNVTLSTTTTTDGPGTVGDTVVYLGEYRSHQRTAHGQTFELVVPERASLAESPDAIFDSVTAAADALRVGDRDPAVLMVAAPTGRVRWAVNGLQTGDADLWVRDESPLDEAGNVWVHEYVHTRQDYEVATETRWFTEASATYYAALLTLEQDRIPFDRFRSRLALGARSPYASTVLADPATWDGTAQYTKGPLVAGELDRRIRLTAAGVSFQSVFRRMNAHDGPVTGSVFTEFVAAAGDSEVAVSSDRYTTTTAVPSMWSGSEHASAFETRLANIESGFDDPTNASAFRVDGPYRTGAIGGNRPISLATGERLTADVVVRNTGTATGEYDVPVSLNGAAIARLDGTLAANATVRRSVDHAFSVPGEYSLSVGGERVGITVRRPATATVSRFDAAQTTITAGETVRLSVTVSNNESVPARSPLALFENGERVDVREVVLEPSTQRHVDYWRTLDDPGEYQFRVGNRTLTVMVREPATATAQSGAGTPGANPNVGQTGTSGGSGDGFGVGLSVVVLVLLGVAVRRWH